MEVDESDKHSSLLRYGNNKRRKKIKVKSTEYRYDECRYAECRCAA